VNVAEPLAPQNRLRPSLLDLLTDEERDKKEELREARVFNKKRLREKAMRDLAWLFNATQLERSGDLAHVPYVRRSVINFGLPAHAGQTASSLEIQDVEQSIKQAILDFEPRILPDTLEVEALVELSDLDRHNVLGIEIRAQFSAEPIPLELLLRTEIDLETGKVQVNDLSATRVS
jgi:type VI secretion system protein ImpF